MRNTGVLCWLTLVVILAAAGTARPQQSPPERKITKIAGNLYRFQNGGHFSVFLVTPRGIIATDPINAEAAKWLKGELEKQFNQPVKYLIYSHDHRDHIAGGEVFDTATVIAHENAKRAIIGEKRPTAVPHLTFADRMTIELGGKTVELQYVGPSHSDNTIVMNFPEERVLFAVDIVTAGRVPFRNLQDAYFPEWIEALDLVEAMDFDILAPGHGPLGNKDDVREHRAYLADLYLAVLEEARAGKSLEEMKKSIKLDKYKHLDRYAEWLPLNIEGMYHNIQLHRRGN